MRSMNRGLLRLAGLCLVLQGSLWAGLSGPLSVRTVGDHADLIVVASIEDVASATRSAVDIRLRIARTIKGETPPSVLTVELKPSPMMSINAQRPEDVLPGSMVDTAGIWFLQRQGAGFRVLPLATGDFVDDEVFLRLRSPQIPEPAAVIPDLPAAGDPVHQRVLAALVDMYLSTPEPAGTLRDMVAASLGKEWLQDSLAAARVLLRSASAHHQVLGLLTMLRLGSDDALPLLAERAAALRSHRMFPAITFALGTEYRPNGESSIAPLLQLTSMHLGATDFDAAVASALRKIGTKAIVPAMIEFLDSQDPTAQLHAARFLSDYALFADAHGNVPVLKPGQGRTFGPWRTEAVHEYTPIRDSTKTPQEYAAFWKGWWAENRAKLGFAGR